VKFAVLGNGGFGTAMALTLARAGHAVALWGHDAAYTATIAATRRNPRYLATNTPRSPAPTSCWSRCRPSTCAA